MYPRETVFLLHGKRHRSTIGISELVVPPFATYGSGFADIPTHMLPVDFSIIGTVHSHPSGDLAPSQVDLNHFGKAVLIIVAFPFEGEKCIASYNNKGERIALEIINV
jgi:proteasome lid subunit RPN8/RPN11